MKLFLRIIKISVGLLVLLVAGIWITFNIANIKGYQFEKSFNKVRTGMNSKQVTDILGKPAQITYSDDSLTFDYWYSSGIILKSTEPSVTFDTTNMVIKKWLGD